MAGEERQEAAQSDMGAQRCVWTVFLDVRFDQGKGSGSPRSSGGLSLDALQVVGDTASVCTSLLIKQLIRFSAEYYSSQRYGTPGPNVGRGIGMAIGLFCLLVLSSLSINHYFLRSSGTGVLARSALISALYERESHDVAHVAAPLTDNHTSKQVPSS